MKKFTAFLLTLVLAFSLSVAAFAEDTTINQNTTDPVGTTKLTYDVKPAYTVTIPATVTLGSTSGTANATVSAENVKIAANEQLVVKITGTSGVNNAFTVTTNEGASLTYTVNSNNTIVNVDEAVLTFAPSFDEEKDEVVDSDEAKLTFALTESAVYAGTYTGTVTFTVSVDPKTSTTP